MISPVMRDLDRVVAAIRVASGDKTYAITTTDRVRLVRVARMGGVPRPVVVGEWDTPADALDDLAQRLEPA